MPTFFDQIPTDDGPPDTPLLEPYDEQELDDRFERLERGDKDEPPTDPPADPPAR
jgi:hypothetical protein